MFINTVINFIIVALAVFILIKQVSRFIRSPEETSPSDDQRMPVLRVEHPGQGHPLPELHFAPGGRAKFTAT